MDADDQRLAAYLPRLADALWRFREDPNWATQGALITACGAIWGDRWAMNELDTNAAWEMPA